MAAFATPCETAALAAGFIAATTAGAFAAFSAKPAAATGSLRPRPGFAAFAPSRFTSLD
ncbi:MAG TPA: hypothetical protein VN715_00335 [Roseiarcus sp.]|nr:hypothetical protein [Roseiarcus sp.]